MPKKKITVNKKVKAVVEEPRLEPEIKDEPKLQPEVKEEIPSVIDNEDYLQQYQYRKQTVFGSVSSNPIPGSKAAKQKTFFLASPKVRIFVPRKDGEDSSIKQTVNVNGYRLDFPKNMYLEMPLPVAEIIMESLKQTEAALVKNLISGNKDKEHALL